MKSILIFITLTVLGLGLIAQIAPEITYGTVTKEALRMEHFEADPEASAVILAHTRVCGFPPSGFADYRVAYTEYFRIKILKESGVDFANFEIPFFQFGYLRERVENIEAQTITYDEATDQMEYHYLDKNEVFESIGEEGLYYKKFTLPKAQKGAIIEVQFQILSPISFFLRTWHFQDKIPTVYSFANIIAPPGATYIFSQSGKNVGIQFLSDPIHGAYAWLARNIPAIREEPYIANYENSRSRMDWKKTASLGKSTTFGLEENFEELSHQFRTDKNFKHLFKKGPAWEKELLPLLQDLPEEEDAKLQLLVQRLKRNYVWNGELGVFADPDMKKVLKDKTGNGTALNMLLHDALKRLGYQVNPVLISTRRHGVVNSRFPIFFQFNHCIIRMVTEEGDVFLDMTSGYGPYDLIPERDINGKALSIEKASHQWVDILPKYAYKSFIHAQLKLDQSGEISGNFNVEQAGYCGEEARSEYLRNYAGNAKAFCQEVLLGDEVAFQVSDAEVTETENYWEPFKASCDLTTEEFSTAVSEKIYLEPLLWAGIKENWFTQNKRVHDIDLNYPHHLRYTAEISLPVGYTTGDMPETVFRKSADGSVSFRYQVEPVGQHLNVLFELKLDSHLYSAKSYPFIRSLFDDIVSKSNEQVVIKKQ